jgi:hypothetical protein
LGKVFLLNIDVSSSANSSAEPLDSEVLLLDSAKAERGTSFFKFLAKKP